MISGRTLPPPQSHLRPDVDEMRMLASWMRLHPEGARQVRWRPEADPDAFVAAVLGAAREATPTAEPEVEETDG